jgi:F-type H+-transporting ATPase subunit delta
MKFTHKQYAQALYEAIADTAPKDQDKVIENFIEILKQKGDLPEYERIITAYEIYDKEQRGITEVEITTAGDTKLSKPLLDELNKLIGKDIEIKEKVDSGIIGGIVVRAGDTLIDGSIKNQLNQLRQDLESN